MSPSLNITLVLCFASFLLGQAFQAFCASLSSPLKSVGDAGTSVSFSFKTLVIVVLSVLVVHDVLIFMAIRHLFFNRQAPAARKHAFKPSPAAVRALQAVYSLALQGARNLAHQRPHILALAARVNIPLAPRAQFVASWRSPPILWLLSAIRASYTLAASTLTVAIAPPRLESCTALVLRNRPSSPVALPLVLWRMGLPDAARRAQHPPQHPLLVLLLRLLLFAMAARSESDVDEVCFATIEELVDTTEDVEEHKTAVALLPSYKASPSSFRPARGRYGQFQVTFGLHLLPLFLPAAAVSRASQRTISYATLEDFDAVIYKVKQAPALGVSYTTISCPQLPLLRHILAAPARQLEIRCAATVDEVRDTADALVVEAVADSSSIEEKKVVKSIKQQVDTSVKEAIADITELEDTLVAEPASDWSSVGETKKVDVIKEVFDAEDTSVAEVVRKSANIHEKVEAVTVAQDPVPTYEESDWGAAPSYEEFASGAPPEPLFAKRPVSLTHEIHRPPSLSAQRRSPRLAPPPPRAPLLPPRHRCLIPSPSPSRPSIHPPPTASSPARPTPSPEKTPAPRGGDRATCRRIGDAWTADTPAIAAANGPRKMLHRGRARARLLGPCAAAFSSGFGVFLGGDVRRVGLWEWG
ncbi:hypothetical protein FB451DRAFT_1562552 [Mycena latifolia]|nr:hypothetical protein FB451DRAFT_1562552 [Mycena latifolia]